MAWKFEKICGIGYLQDFHFQNNPEYQKSKFDIFPYADSEFWKEFFNKGYLTLPENPYHIFRAYPHAPYSLLLEDKLKRKLLSTVTRNKTKLGIQKNAGIPDFEDFLFMANCGARIPCLQEDLSDNTYEKMPKWAGQLLVSQEITSKINWQELQKDLGSYFSQKLLNSATDLSKKQKKDLEKVLEI